MKFDTQYPQFAKPMTYIGPHQEVQVSEDTLQSWRLYPCATCGNLTSWRVALTECAPVPCCSEECREPIPDLGVFPVEAADGPPVEVNPAESQSEEAVGEKSEDSPLTAEPEPGYT